MEAHKIGLFIKELREEKGLTQMGLANALNISDKTISKWECGLGVPDITLLLPISSFFNITVNELLRGEKAVEDNLTPLAKAVNSGIPALFDYDKQGRGQNLSFPDESGKTFLEYFVEFELYDYLRVFMSLIKSSGRSRYPSFLRPTTGTYLMHVGLHGKKSKIELDDETIRFLKTIGGSDVTRHFIRTTFKTNLDKLFVGLIEKKHYELAEEILGQFGTHNKKYTEIALNLGCSFEVARCFADKREYQQLEKTELMKNGTHYEKERVTYLETYDINTIDSAETLPTESQRRNIVNVAINSEDDELICRMLDYEIELHDRHLVDLGANNSRSHKLLVHSIMDYFGTNNKKDLFKKYISKENVDQLLYLMNRSANYIVEKFIHNRLSSNEIDCYRDYALNVLKNPSVRFENSSIPGSSINNYIFDHEDLKMYEIVQKYHILPKMGVVSENYKEYRQTSEIFREYRRLIFQEKTNYKSNRKVDIDRIIAYVESKKELHEHMALVAKKFKSTEARSNVMAFKEYLVYEFKNDRILKKTTSRKPIFAKLWKIQDFDFFLRVVQDLNYDEIESDIWQYQPEIGDIQKIKWILQNITRKLSNSDLALLFMSGND